MIFLINPFQRIKQHGSNVGLTKLIGKKTGNVPLALPLLAALTPDRFTVRIVDEEMAPLPKDVVPDLVGITAMTTNVSRGFEIADHYRSLGVPVVMGGPYVSVCVDDAMTHADSVVKGEADTLWGTLLEDFEAGRLKKIYETDGFIDFKRSVLPRWDLVDISRVSAIPVQASRGCPFNCEFCLVSELFGHRMRYREIDDVIAEISAAPLKTIFFTDDNLTANKEYSRELMRRLKPLQIQWFCMASIEIAEFPDLLREMADCGCMHILVGFESLNPESLQEAHKRQNRIEKYEAAIARIHEAGIHVLASMIVGFDHDTLQEFDRIHAFTRRCNLWYVNVNILDVIPGSRLHQRIVDEGRWIDRPTGFSGGLFPVMHYNRISQRDLFDRNFSFVNELFAFDDVAARIGPLFETGAFAVERVNRDVSGLNKALMTFKLLWIYVVRGDSARRRFFFKLIGLIRRKKVAIEKVVFVLLTVEGIHRQMADLAVHLDEWRKAIDAADKGPWEKRAGV